MHPPLTSVLHEVGEPFLSVICLLLTKGLEQNNHITHSLATFISSVYFYVVRMLFVLRHLSLS